MTNFIFMMKFGSRKYLLIAVIICITSYCEKSFAQQLPQFAYGASNPEFYNPSVCGITKSIDVSLIGRTQWIGITGHPNAQAISLSSYVPSLSGGLGIFVLNNQQGVQRNTYTMLGYSFIAGKKNNRFGIGVRGGIIQSSIDGAKLRAPDGDYSGSIINHNDNLLPINTVSSIAPDFYVGIFYLNKFMNIGFAGSHLLQPALKFSAANGDLTANLERNILTSISFSINKNKDISFKPSAIVKYNFNELQTESSLLVGYKNLGWVGVGYRGFDSNAKDAAIGFLGINLNSDLSVGYAYEYSLSKLSTANDGSHELVIHYSTSLTKPAKPEKVIFTPRF